MESNHQSLNYDEQYKVQLELWKYFTDDAAKIKDRLWTICSWMFTVQSGLLAFISKYLPSGKETIGETNTLVVTGASLVGILLGIYTVLMIFQYGNHIRGMWNRADMVRRKVPGLSEIWFLNNTLKIEDDIKFSDKEVTSLPKVASRLTWLSAGFMLIFLITALIMVL